MSADRPPALGWSCSSRFDELTRTDRSGKLTAWVLAERGHGPDFRRARGLEPGDRELVRAALLVHVREQPVEGVRASHALVGPQAGDWAVDGPSRSAAGAPG